MGISFFIGIYTCRKNILDIIKSSLDQIVQKSHYFRETIPRKCRFNFKWSSGIGWRATKCIVYGSIIRKSKDKWAGTFITWVKIYLGSLGLNCLNHHCWETMRPQYQWGRCSGKSVLGISKEKLYSEIDSSEKM